MNIGKITTSPAAKSRVSRRVPRSSANCSGVTLKAAVRRVSRATSKPFCEATMSSKRCEPSTTNSGPSLTGTSPRAIQAVSTVSVVRVKKP